MNQLLSASLTDSFRRFLYLLLSQTYFCHNFCTALGFPVEFDTGQQHTHGTQHCPVLPFRSPYWDTKESWSRYRVQWLPEEWWSDLILPQYTKFAVQARLVDINIEHESAASSSDDGML